MSRARTLFRQGLKIVGGGMVASLPFAWPLLTPNNKRDNLSLHEKHKRGVAMTEQQVRATLIVEAAFKDLGFHAGNVYVKFVEPFNETMQVNVSAARNNIHKEVTVEISGKLQADQSLYALAGREAATVMMYHKEASVLAFYTAFTALMAVGVAAKTSPLIVLPVAYATGFLIHKSANRILALDADLQSASHLGTARVLSMTLDRNDPELDPDRPNAEDSELLDAINYLLEDYPTTTKRCSELNAIRAYDLPTFFSSPARMKEFEETVHRYSNKI